MSAPATVPAPPAGAFPAGSAGPAGRRAPLLPPRGTPDHHLAVQDRLAAWVCDLSLLHELTERLSRTSSLDDTLREVLRAGASLVGAGRGLVALDPADGLGPDLTVGLGLGHADLGSLETVEYQESSPWGSAGAFTGRPGTTGGRAPATSAPTASGTGTTPGMFAMPGTPDIPEAAATPGTSEGSGFPGATGTAGTPDASGTSGPAASTTGQDSTADLADPMSGSGAEAHPASGTGDDLGPSTGLQETLLRDLRHDPSLSPRHREVAAQLGLGASYALGLTAGGSRLGTAVWFYDEPAEPTDRRRRLASLYLRFANEHIARCLDLRRARCLTSALAAELLPARLPRVAGVRMAVRHRTGPRGGGDWYDALPLPEGALGLAVGGVTGAGPSAVAAMGRLRASLRAYAVMEGEDPVAVLSDLELLMRLTEPERSATALFGHVAAAAGGGRKLILAGAGHCPPLVVGDRRCEYVETSLSAPLNMLSCWEAPSVELRVRPTESLVLFTDGLLHRTGESADRAFALVHAAAQSAPRSVREDPERLADHVLDAVLPDGLDRSDGAEDLVLLVVGFD